MPTVSIRVTPAASAAATSSALGGSHRSQVGVGVDHLSAVQSKSIG